MRGLWDERVIWWRKETRGRRINVHVCLCCGRIDQSRDMEAFWASMCCQLFQNDLGVRIHPPVTRMKPLSQRAGVLQKLASLTIQSHMGRLLEPFDPILKKALCDSSFQLLTVLH